MHFVPKTSVGVLIVDDSLAFCKLIARLLQLEPNTHIVGVAGNLDDALQIAVRHTPDVVLLDLHLDDLAGHDPQAIKLGFLSCARHMIAMSTRTDEEERLFAQLHGATGLIDKFFLSEQLIPTILYCRSPRQPLAHLSPRSPAPTDRFVS